MRSVTVLLTAGFIASTSGAVMAAGTTTTEPPKPTETTTECEDGQIWDEDAEECVDAEESRFDDDTLYTAARELAYDGQYKHAIAILTLAKNQNDPRILNYLGFSHRKAGRYNLGMKYYRAAIAADPNYILARSYMGQALAQRGDKRGAREQLQEIRARGGAGTWAEKSLAKAINSGNFSNY